MATIPPHDPKEESSTMAAAAQNSLKAEYEAALTAYNDQCTAAKPPREKYDELYLKHKKLQARYENVLVKLSSRQPAYRQHKRYFSYLSNTLLASNANMRASPQPISDLQTLTHATLVHKFKHASHTLTDMICENKRLDNAKDLFFERDQKLRERCHFLYHVVDRDCQKADELHVEVLAAKEKLGGKPDCGGIEGGKCPACARTKAAAEKEAKAVAEKEAKAAVDKEAKAAVEKEAKINKGRGKSTGKGPKAKGSLEHIVEEEELEVGAKS